MSTELEELQEYVDYLETESRMVREYLDGFNTFNTGSISDDVETLVESLIDDGE